MTERHVCMAFVQHRVVQLPGPPPACMSHVRCNHESKRSRRQHVVQSEWAELFIRYNKFWGGEPSEQNLAMIYTRKPRPPFREVTHADGNVQKVRSLPLSAVLTACQHLPTC